MNGLQIDSEHRQIWIDGVLISVKFSEIEIKMLLCLGSHNGEICRRAETVLYVYGVEYEKFENKRLDAMIERTRKKLEKFSVKGRFLNTVYKEGHRLKEYNGEITA